MLRSGGGGGASTSTIIEVVGAPGPTGPQGAPGQSYGSALLSGGAVRYVSGLQFVVSAASYVINATTYASPETTVTLTTADVTNPRIDVIALTSSNTAVAVAGTAGATPAEASIDPLSQLRLTAVTVATNATTIGVTTTNIYLENTEWTSSVSGASVVASSTTNPHVGTKDIEFTAAAAAAYVNLSNGSAFDLSTRNFLSFYVRNKAAWPSAKSVVIQWYNGTQAVGAAVTFKHGAYGFDQTNVTTYQSIGIPLSAFGAFGLTTTAVRFTVTGGGSAIGFYLDDIVLQGGVATATPSDAMRYRGVYSAAVQYQINDVVSSSGSTYIALTTSLGTTPVAGAIWASIGGSGGGGMTTSTVEASYTRPSDTTTYAAGDVLCNSTSAGVVLTFSSVVATSAGGGVIQAVTFVDSANQSSLYLNAELWLFDTAPTMQNDNVAFAASDSEVAKVVGIVPISDGNWRAGGANAINDIQNMSLPFNCAAASTTLYGVIVVRNAYVPISAEVFTVRLHVIT